MWISLIEKGNRRIPQALECWNMARPQEGFTTNWGKAGFSTMYPYSAPHPTSASPCICCILLFLQIDLFNFSADMRSKRWLFRHFLFWAFSFSRLAQTKLDLLVIASNPWERWCACPCISHHPFIWGEGSSHIVQL